MFAKSARVATLVYLSALCSVLIGDRLGADDWPQFRGPNCSGLSASNKPLPVKFTDTENTAWSAKVGDGVGCPVVAAGRAVVSGILENGDVALFAFDAATGEK